MSFSGSLIENLNTLEAAGANGGIWNNWDASYRQAVAMDTSLGNPRLDQVAFGYYHPLMPLLDERDMRMQIKLHRHAYQQAWGADPSYSLGMFPPETAFSQRMIPALVAEVWDGKGSVNLVWIGRRSIAGIEPGVFLRAKGRVAEVRGAPTIFNPSYEIVPTQ